MSGSLDHGRIRQLFDELSALELERIEVLRAEGERGRRYRAEWIRAGGAGDRLDVTVTDPSRPGEDHGARERVLLRTTGDGVVRSLEEANAVVNRYEQAAAGRGRPEST